jgi:hypothetical protein
MMVSMIGLLSMEKMTFLRPAKPRGGWRTTMDAPPNWPPLSSLIDKDTQEIRGNVEFLLDFICAGFSKTATTSFMAWLGGHEEIQMYDGELRALRNNSPAVLVERLYEDLLPGSQYKRGYKAPNGTSGRKSSK